MVIASLISLRRRAFVKASLASRPYIIAALTLAATVCAPACLYQKDWSMETTSPNGVFRVHLTGKAEPPKHSLELYGDHHVTLTLLEGGKELLTNDSFYGGDSYDDLFWERYSSHKWLSNSILSFNHPDSLQHSREDELIIRNDSDVTYHYFKVTANGTVDEMFLIFGFAPGAEVHLYPQAQGDGHSDRSGFSCLARKGGKYIEGSGGLEFYDRDKQAHYEGLARYLINVGEAKIDVTGYKVEAEK
jgi:hypothetical protein